MLHSSIRNFIKPLYNQPLNQLICWTAIGSSRGFHSSSATQGAKNDLAVLRKKTGYSLSICKKALLENENDLGKAEAWLKEQAQAHGWAKAQKLQGRNTTQGLLGVRVHSNSAAMVELNCETDFVARNKTFLSLLDLVNETCLTATGSNEDGDLSKTVINREAVGNLMTKEGKSLADVVALNIGQIGENMALGSANVFTARSGVQLAGLSHPSIEIYNDKLQYGRYGAILAYTSSDSGILPEGQTLDNLVKQICQHIIGMAPTAVNNEDDKESSLLHQPFLLDEEVTVGDLTESAGITVVDFIRREVGRDSEAN